MTAVIGTALGLGLTIVGSLAWGSAMGFAIANYLHVKSRSKPPAPKRTDSHPARGHIHAA